MSKLNVQEIVSFPGEKSVDEIVAGDHIDIISPFYSGWALRKLEKEKKTQVRLITRLPQEYFSAPALLDNDPRPLRRAMGKLGSSLSVFALPSVHAKLYLTPAQAWVGSSNFTRNGFSGKGELILRVVPPTQLLTEVFESFLVKAKRVTQANVNFLIDSLASKVTELRPQQPALPESDDLTLTESISYEDFGEWLSSREDDYLRARFSNKNRMSGHVYSGFHGVVAFINKNQNFGRTLLKKNASEADMDRLADFVRRYGNKFGGPRGGTWNSKLSTRLGGTQSGGGAGDAVVKHLLAEVPKYLRQRGLI